MMCRSGDSLSSSHHGLACCMPRIHSTGPVRCRPWPSDNTCQSLGAFHANLICEDIMLSGVVCFNGNAMDMGFQYRICLLWTKEDPIHTGLGFYWEDWMWESWRLWTERHSGFRFLRVQDRLHQEEDHVTGMESDCCFSLGAWVIHLLLAGLGSFLGWFCLNICSFIQSREDSRVYHCVVEK